MEPLPHSQAASSSHTLLGLLLLSCWEALNLPCQGPKGACCAPLLTLALAWCLPDLAPLSCDCLPFPPPPYGLSHSPPQASGAQHYIILKLLLPLSQPLGEKAPRMGQPKSADSAQCANVQCHTSGLWASSPPGPAFPTRHY